MRALLNRLADLLGRRCHGCGGVASGPGRGQLPPLCPDCAAGLAGWTGSACPGCGQMYAGATGDGTYLCSACRLAPRPWDRLYFFGAYEGLLRRLVLDYKFNNRLGAGRLLLGLAREAWLRGEARCPAPGPDVVLPVPLHRRRLMKRGFNQSLQLARGVGRFLGAPVHAEGLVRVRHTVPQMTLGAAQRRDNVRGAFAACAPDVAGRRVLLVDDVMTTGGTLEECARELRRAGASGVSVLVVARTPAGR